MPQLQLEEIKPTRDNAHQVQSILLDDFKRLFSMSSDRARLIANPDDTNFIDIQLAKLKKNEGQYLALMENQSWYGIARMNDWLHGDEAPFVTRSRNLADKALYKVGVRHPRLGGLHAFARSSEVTLPGSQHTKIFFDHLLDEARERGYTELRAAVDNEDWHLIDQFNNQPDKAAAGFGSTGWVPLNNDVLHLVGEEVARLHVQKRYSLTVNE